MYIGRSISSYFSLFDETSRNFPTNDLIVNFQKMLWLIGAIDKHFYFIQ